MSFVSSSAAHLCAPPVSNAAGLLLPRSSVAGDALMPPSTAVLPLPKPTPEKTPSTSLAKRTAVACISCHRSKAGCDEGRPCLRCIRLGKENECYDRPQRRVGRPPAKRQREEIPSALSDGDAQSNLGTWKIRSRALANMLDHEEPFRFNICPMTLGNMRPEVLGLDAEMLIPVPVIKLGIVHQSLPTLLVGLNHQAQKVLGKTQKELCEVVRSSLVPPGTLQPVRPLLWRCFHPSDWAELVAAENAVMVTPVSERRAQLRVMTKGKEEKRCVVAIKSVHRLLDSTISLAYVITPLPPSKE